MADVYVHADVAERDRIGDGVVTFNARLADDPFAVGESREFDIRIAFPPLLCVYFLVDITSRQVRVTRVIRYGK